MLLPGLWISWTVLPAFLAGAFAIGVSLASFRRGGAALEGTVAASRLRESSEPACDK